MDFAGKRKWEKRGEGEEENGVEEEEKSWNKGARAHKKGRQPRGGEEEKGEKKRRGSPPCGRNVLAWHLSAM